MKIDVEGIASAIATCHSCDWNWHAMATAKRTARKHAKRCGHFVVVETVSVVHYDGRGDATRVERLADGRYMFPKNVEFRKFSRTDPFDCATKLPFEPAEDETMRPMRGAKAARERKIDAASHSVPCGGNDQPLADPSAGRYDPRTSVGAKYFWRGKQIENIIVTYKCGARSLISFQTKDGSTFESMDWELAAITPSGTLFELTTKDIPIQGDASEKARNA